MWILSETWCNFWLEFVMCSCHVRLRRLQKDDTQRGRGRLSLEGGSKSAVDYKVKDSTSFLDSKLCTMIEDHRVE